MLGCETAGRALTDALRFPILMNHARKVTRRQRTRVNQLLLMVKEVGHIEAATI